VKGSARGGRKKAEPPHFRLNIFSGARGRLWGGGFGGGGGGREKGTLGHTKSDRPAASREGRESASTKLSFEVERISWRRRRVTCRSDLSFGGKINWKVEKGEAFSGVNRKTMITLRRKCDVRKRSEQKIFT